MNLKGIFAIAIGVISSICFYFKLDITNTRQKHAVIDSAPEIIAAPQSGPFVSIFQEEAIDGPPIPLEEYVEPLRIKEFSLLNKKELEYYHKHTWDPFKTLEQNRRALTSSFLKTCVDRVEDVVTVDDGIILKLASRDGPIVLKPASVEFIRDYELNKIIYLMTDSPYFCRLLRSLLAKYKTMCYTPQKAVFLITKGEASHTIYNILHHVLNLRILDQTFLSALDCTRHKMQFGATVFHEMLHWYHQLSNPAECERRSKSTSCIRRSFYAHQSINAFHWYEDAIIQSFSNDEEYYTMYGLVEDEYGGIAIDTLCEAAYTYEQYGYIRGSHRVFNRRSEEKNFIVRARNSSLLKFFQDSAPLKFGEGEFRTLERATV
ncbi:MAG: hypothetical protein LBD81_02315 [Holosporaceae bacterium]|jgi:hypothetical protein|nr:hypothetical protein [Holosporaceae bacterium]